jgi:hypothetical protein
MPQTYDLDWNGDVVEHLIGEATADGLVLATEFLLQVSRAVVPLEEATLERSGVASVDRDAMTGAVSYDTVYAARQHEERTWRHAPGRKAGYLGDTAIAERDTIAALIAAPPRAVVQGGN